MVQVNVRIPPELHERLTAKATRLGTTATAVVTEALRKDLRNEGSKKA